ncbi:response regulator transcription factor [Alishewanella sp. d11]|uniref:response regulator transcription factor n=1 Tax=Alishewanella sp. d11 TaxID=3414030 RepID=UPI003BF86526
MNTPLQVLYFEDDEATANLVLLSLRNQGYQVQHFSEFPAGGIAEIRDHCIQEVDLVILDINMPGLNGYAICQLLKQELLAEHVPVLFTSGLMQDEDILKAFDAGADDYLIKPLRINELVLKIPKLIALKKEQIEAAEQASAAMKIAFDAMKNSSELGGILRFYEVIQQAEDFDNLANMLFDAIKEFELESTLVITVREPALYYRDDKLLSSLELESILAARSKGRIYSWRKYTFFSYQYFTVLIRNMPIDDEDRYGILKDQLCLLLNGVDVRIAGIILKQDDQKKQKRLAATSKVLAQLVLDIENENVEFSSAFEKILADLETNLSAEIAQFNLLEQEERLLLAITNEGMSQARALLDNALDTETLRKDVINNLLSQLSTDSH